ncbi:hypothetical protein [uncultured Draconibacterium sp.]|uniref:hypothetical protein n=1 Tax=uncultured Draconibacterium sp. TaxID=1573823 RepID=UPI0025EFED71|nr:hypothetical protein [uncultured Draconibacterium sp.]
MKQFFKNYTPFNTIENILVVILTVVFMKVFVINPMQKMYETRLDKQTAVIVELAKIEKYKIQNDFEKMKAHKGSDIVLDLNNTLNALELETMPLDTIPAQPEKKGFFKRLFSGK